MRKSILICVLFLFLTSTSSVFAQVKAIYFGRVIDGHGKILTDAVIITNADRIVAVGAENSIEIPANAKIIDLRRYTAIPGLIDAHTHMTYYWDKKRGGDPWGQLGT